jgi:hypothetical protein
MPFTISRSFGSDHRSLSSSVITRAFLERPDKMLRELMEP